MQASHSCPLCAGQDLNHYHRDKLRDYWQCSQCLLVFVAPEQHLSEAQEKQRYDLHDNNIQQQGYCDFLNQLLIPLVVRLPTAAKGLDFGSGPGPTVSLLLAQQGFQVACYDKYYAADRTLLKVQYDFITSTEVLEHVREPAKVFQQLNHMLKPNGYLGIMTQLQPDKARFAKWHYKQDQTHICFYAVETFEWLAKRWNLSLEILGKDVIILRKGN